MGRLDAIDIIVSYARSGIRVFPLHHPINGKCSCGRDCASPAKHPRTKNGAHDATVDIGQIAEWAARYRSCNWGAVPPPHALILDVDPRHQGDVNLAALEAEHGALPDTLRATTGGGGKHIWLGYSGPTRGALVPGVDIKVSTGYIVAPPSRHISGRLYSWDNELPIQPAPRWLKLMLNPPEVRRPSRRPAKAAGSDREGGYLIQFVACSMVGEINNRVYWAAVRAGELDLLDDPTFVEKLVDAARDAAGSHATSGGEHQTRRTIESARTPPARSPAHGAGGGRAS